MLSYETDNRNKYVYKYIWNKVVVAVVVVVVVEVVVVVYEMLNDALCIERGNHRPARCLYRSEQARYGLLS